MNYREFGKTGTKISALGYGCMRLPELEENGKFTMDYDRCDEMLRRAVDLGVNYFDTGLTYCHENSERAVGHALAPVRGKVMISTKCPMERVHSAADYEKCLDESLQKLGTEYVDFYHFWAMDRNRFDNCVLKYDLINEALKMKAKGKIRHISFSFHDDPSVIKYMVDTAPELETMLAQYNLLDRSNEEMFEYVHKKGLGTVVMGPVGGGRLAAPTALYQKLTGKPEAIATYELALRFVLGNPNIDCALSGMTSPEMVEQNAAVASLENPMTPEEWAAVAEANENLKKFSELYCTGCNYCQPCPADIHISEIFQAYTYHNVYGLNEAAKNTYQNRYLIDMKGKTSADCLNCGYCESKCPQHLKIREELKRVEKILAGL